MTVASYIWHPGVTYWQHHSQWIINRKLLRGWSHFFSLSESLQVRWEERRMVGRSPCMQIDQTFNKPPTHLFHFCNVMCRPWPKDRMCFCVAHREFLKGMIKNPHILWLSSLIAKSGKSLPLFVPLNNGQEPCYSCSLQMWIVIRLYY